MMDHVVQSASSQDRSMMQNKNDATIEKEALAATWASERLNESWVWSNVYTLETDHKPLVPLLSTKEMTKETGQR